MTWQELLSDAFFENGTYSPGETVDSEHIEFAAGRLNSMLDSWKGARLNIYRLQRTGPFSLVSGTQTYTIGAGATWDTPRPVWIDYAGLVQTVGGGSPVPEFPMTPMTDFEWAKTVTKTLQSTIPTALWYDRTFTALGYGTIYIWPVPTVANQVALYSPVPIDEITYPDDLADTVLFPPGYKDFIMYHTAIRIGPAFGLPRPSATTVEMAAKAMELVKNDNLRLNVLRVDDALIAQGGYYNWLSDSTNMR